MAQIKLNVQSSDKLKALIGDLGIECEIPVSALVEYVNNNIVITEEITFPNGTLQDIQVDGNTAVVQDSSLIIQIGGNRYRIATEQLI